VDDVPGDVLRSPETAVLYPDDAAVRWTSPRAPQIGPQADCRTACHTLSATVERDFRRSTPGQVEAHDIARGAQKLTAVLVVDSLARPSARSLKLPAASLDSTVLASSGLKSRASPRLAATPSWGGPLPPQQTVATLAYHHGGPTPRGHASRAHSQLHNSVLAFPYAWCAVGWALHGGGGLLSVSRGALHCFATARCTPRGHLPATLTLRPTALRAAPCRGTRRRRQLSLL
jgi:hypothetical protein